MAKGAFGAGFGLSTGSGCAIASGAFLRVRPDPIEIRDGLSSLSTHDYECEMVRSRMAEVQVEYGGGQPAAAVGFDRRSKIYVAAH